MRRLTFVRSIAAAAGADDYARRLANETARVDKTASVIDPADIASMLDDGATIIIDMASLQTSTAMSAHLQGSQFCLLGGAPPSDEAAASRLSPVMRAAHRVIVPAEAMGVRLTELFQIGKDCLRVVAPGVDDLPRATGSGGPACSVISVAGALQHRGVADLIEALSKLFDLDWRLTVALTGRIAGDQIAAIRDAAARRAVSGRVSIIADPEAGDLDRVWQGADVFARISGWEPSPTPLNAALRRGLPVAITAAVGTIPAEAGIVCSFGDVAGLSKSLRRLIFDTELRGKMAEVAWQAGRALPDWPTQARLLHAALNDGT